MAEGLGSFSAHPRQLLLIIAEPQEDAPSHFEVQTSSAGQTLTSQGTFYTGLRWKDLPASALQK